MDRQKLLEHIRRIILEARPRLSPSHVTESTSMTRDLELDHQDAHGAAGSMSCTGVSAIGASSPVDITITFDGTV